MLGSLMNFIFGPVPSRRLGRSIGINHIPPKICSFACVYCQLGREKEMTRRRRLFWEPERIVRAAEEALSALPPGEPVDYLTLVPDGEPTLDSRLDELIRGLRPLGVPLALITNSSLMGDPEVRETLMGLDWVSVKADAAREEVWRRVDRPHGRIDFDTMRQGLLRFSRDFGGGPRERRRAGSPVLASETMLVEGVNDRREDLAGTADFLGELQPDIAYAAVPTRPPSEGWVHPADEAALGEAFRLFSNRVPRTELLIGYEGNAFSATGDFRHDILSITAVHPMREDAVAELLAGRGGTKSS